MQIFIVVGWSSLNTIVGSVYFLFRAACVISETAWLALVTHVFALDRAGTRRILEKVRQKEYAQSLLCEFVCRWSCIPSMAMWRNVRNISKPRDSSGGIGCALGDLWSTSNKICAARDAGYSHPTPNNGNFGLISTNQSATVTA